MNSTKGDNTPTNTLREEVLEILRYPNNKRPERFTIATQIRHFQADQLVELIAQAVNKARLDMGKQIYLNLGIEEPKVTRYNFERSRDKFLESSVDGVDVALAIDNAIKELETPNQVESME